MLLECSRTNQQLLKTKLHGGLYTRTVPKYFLFPSKNQEHIHKRCTTTHFQKEKEARKELKNLRKCGKKKKESAGLACAPAISVTTITPVVIRFCTPRWQCSIPAEGRNSRPEGEVQSKQTLTQATRLGSLSIKAKGGRGNNRCCHLPKRIVVVTATVSGTRPQTLQRACDNGINSAIRQTRNAANLLLLSTQCSNARWCKRNPSFKFRTNSTNIDYEKHIWQLVFSAQSISCMVSPIFSLFSGRDMGIVREAADMGCYT